MNEIVFKTKRGKVISAFFAGDGDYPKANLSYSLEDIAGEVFLDELVNQVRWKLRSHVKSLKILVISV